MVEWWRGRRVQDITRMYVMFGGVHYVLGPKTLTPDRNVHYSDENSRV